MRIFLLSSILLSFVLLSTSVFGNDWKESFYTDDSPFYVKLFSTGFSQRFRVEKESCKQIESAEIVLKSSYYTSYTSEVFFSQTRMTDEMLKKWPAPYGVNNTKHCWYKLEVKGIDLNKPNPYVIRVIDKEAAAHYFTAVGNSLLPKNRFVQEAENILWIDLGDLGATPVEDGGIFFKIWEPPSDTVELFLNGNFDKPIKMVSTRGKGDTYRTHIRYLPDAKPGDKYVYKFKKNGIYEILEVTNFEHFSDWKVDPMAKMLDYQSKGGEYNGFYYPTAIVAGPSEYQWKNDYTISSLKDEDADNWIIYQLWPLAFNPQKKDGKYVQGTFRDVARKAEYFEDLGVNAVELLPINEGRFYASWGYALDSLTLIEKTYGTRDDLRYLVDRLHQSGLRVVLDIVLNHLNNFLIRDPQSPTLSDTKYFKGSSPWGPRPKFQCPMVRKWMADSLIYLINEFHIDGFRYDMVEVIYKNDPVGRQFLQELNDLIRLVHPKFYSSAEQLPDDVEVTYPPNEGGLGYDSQWNDRFKNFFELKFDYFRPYNRAVDLGELAQVLLGYSGGENYRHFGAPSRTVNYLGSHDFVGNKNPFMRIISGYEAYESVNGVHFVQVKPLEDRNNFMQAYRAIHNQFTHDLGKLAHGILFTKPGAALFFQGEEMASDVNIENEWSYLHARDGFIPTKNVDVGRYVGSHRTPWEYLYPSQSPALSFLSDSEIKQLEGYNQFFKEMIKFKKENPLINLRNAHNTKIYYDNTLITYEVNAGLEDYFIVANFGEKNNGKWISFPGSTKIWWEEVINSSLIKYGGETDRYHNIIPNIGNRANLIRLQSSAFMVFQKKLNAHIARPLYLRGSFNDWEARDEFILEAYSERGDIYGTSITCKKSGLFKFKLGTKEWEVDMGAPHVPNDEKSQGTLSNRPDGANAKIVLQKGKYNFIFNLRSFKYRFEKID